MNTTPALNLPYLYPAQAQKHVTYNEALQSLDGLVQTSVVNWQRLSPPDSPAQGESFLVGDGASGAFLGHDRALARFIDNDWVFYQPAQGWRVWLNAENRLLVFDGHDWIYVSNMSNADTDTAIDRLGINTEPDDVNRLAVKSEAILMSYNESADNGNMYLNLNKAGPSDTASLLFQSAWEGRAEIGIIRDNDFRIKVHNGDDIWKDALIIEGSSGAVSMPLTPSLALDVNIQSDIRTKPALKIRGAAISNTEDITHGVGLYLTHNSSFNRQFALLSTDTRVGVRVVAVSYPIIDGYINGARADLQIGSNTHGAHISANVANTQFSVSNWAGTPTKTVCEIVGAATQSGDLLAVGPSLLIRGQALRVTSESATIFGGAAVLKSYTVADLPGVDQKGAMIFVSDASGGAVPAFSDGTAWRRVTDREIISQV